MLATTPGRPCNPDRMRSASAFFPASSDAARLTVSTQLYIGQLLQVVDVAHDHAAARLDEVGALARSHRDVVDYPDWLTHSQLLCCCESTALASARRIPPSRAHGP